jgi:hypothetical protein
MIQRLHLVGRILYIEEMLEGGNSLYLSARRQMCNGSCQRLYPLPGEVVLEFGNVYDSRHRPRKEQEEWPKMDGLKSYFTCHCPVSYSVSL